MKFVSKDGLRYYHQKKVKPAIRSCIDLVLDKTSENAVSNKAVTTELEKKLPLTGGTIIGSLSISKDVSAESFIGELTGNASSANKLNTNAGSATQPVYFKDGVPIATTYTLGKSVPSNAVFTDTKYTHPSYTARTGKPTANQTPAFGGTATVSQITSDATGHVTGATDRTITIPSTLSNGTGTAGLIKTTSTVTSNSGYTACPVISGVPYYKDTNTTYTSLKNPYALTIQGNGTTLTNGTYDGSAAKTVNITPSSIGAATSSHTHNYAGSSSAGGAATSANKLNTNAGSATQPVYFKDGVPIATTYTLGKSVPSNAVFTDTNTWRGVQNNLTSTSTTESLSAHQGYLLANGSARDNTKLPLTGGTITADSDNSTYGKAALNIANKTSGSSTIFPSISFMQINVSDANLIMKSGYFYRKTGGSATYSRIYDSGDNSIDTIDSIAVGGSNYIAKSYSAAFGYKNTVAALESAAFGYNNQISSDYPLNFVIGGGNSVTGGYGATAIGTQCKVAGQHAFATGDYAESNKWCTVAMGDHTLANGDCQTVFGHYNVSSTAGSIYGTSGDALIIGNGYSNSKSNAFRVTFAGLTYAKGAYSSTGADYAEYFEWEDGNPNNEDRRGLFVTFTSGNKIRIANTDEYILGIVSGKPVIIGNTDDDDQWAHRFLKDEYGDFIKQHFKQEREVKVIDEETGEEKTEIMTEDVEFYVENPEYDPSKEYVTREQRPEWTPIGMLGVLSVRDDGSCVVNGYCKCSNDGIATSSDRCTDSYRVIERVTDNIIKVVLK